MFGALTRLLIIAFTAMLIIPLYAQNIQLIQPVIENRPKEVVAPIVSKQPDTKPQEEKNTFLDFINKKAYAGAVNKDEEKKILREEWKKLLNIDIFYPYFKAKEAENAIKEKASIKIFKMRGRPKFSNDQIKYTFEVKF